MGLRKRFWQKVENFVNHRRLAIIKKEVEHESSNHIYSAFDRCICGAGLIAVSKRGYWDCAEIVLGTAAPFGDSGYVKHSSPYPFALYEIKSENQPSAKGATTRNRLLDPKSNFEFCKDDDDDGIIRKRG